MTHASNEPKFIGQTQLSQIIKDAEKEQIFYVRTYHVRQLAEHKAREMQREDLKFVVKK